MQKINLCKYKIVVVVVAVMVVVAFAVVIVVLSSVGVLEALPFCRAARINKDLKQTAGCVRHNFHNFTPQICKISGHYLRQLAPAVHPLPPNLLYPPSAGCAV